MHILVVGAGFAGATCARQLAEAGSAVTVVDRREHIGGNAYDHLDAHGVLVHRYGPHIFHTNSEKVFAFLSRFTEWRLYEHRVLAQVGELQLPIPINRTTINRLYGLDLDEAGVAAYLEGVREPREPLASSEDVVLNSVGRHLCDTFFRGYTRKQWGRELSELSAGVAARIPTRTNDDDRYFTDRFQGMPLHGYTAMFARLLDHPGITVRTGTDHRDVRAEQAWDHVVFSGPVDEYFDFRLGKLPYRSLRFEHRHIADSDGTVLPVGTVNHPNAHAYTRETEFRHLTGQEHSGTSLVREFPTDEGDPYYPIPAAANEALFKRYQALADAEPGVTFVGRLAQYRYYNMDQVVAAALHACEALQALLAQQPAAGGPVANEELAA
jgi:UDP-galactopyranose mutase